MRLAIGIDPFTITDWPGLAAYVAGSGAVTGTALILMAALLVAGPCIAPRRLGAPAHPRVEE